MNLASAGSQISIKSINRTNGVSSTFLQPSSATPTMLGRFDVNGTTGYSIQANTFQVFGVSYLQNSGPSSILRIGRSDVSGLEANFNLAGSIGNWTGTGLVGYSLESTGGLYLKDFDANRATFIRSLANGSTTDYVSLIEPFFDGAQNLVRLGFGSSGAYAASAVDLGAASGLTSVSGTGIVRVTTGGVRVTPSGIIGGTDAGSALRIDSTTSGVLFPRMTGAERDAISAPIDGLVIFNTATSKLQVRAGAAWVDLH